MEAGPTSRKPGSKYIAVSGGIEYHVGVGPDDAATLNGLARDVHLESIDGACLFSLLVGDKSYEVFVEAGEGEYSVTVEGERYRVQVVDEQPARPGGPPARRRLETRTTTAPGRSAGRGSGADSEATAGLVAGAGAVVSPMTGVLVEFLAVEGQEVRAGDGVAILEAMKTRNVIRAPCDGVVRNVQAAVGQTIRMDHVILYVDAQEG